MDGSDPRGRVLSAEHGDTLRDYGEGEVRRQGTRNRMPTQLRNIGSHSSMWYNDLPSDSKPPFPSAEGEGRRVRRWEWRQWWRLRRRRRRRCLLAWSCQFVGEVEHNPNSTSAAR